MVISRLRVIPPSVNRIKTDRGRQGFPGPKGDAFEYADFTPAQIAALKGEIGPIGPPGEVTLAQLNSALAPYLTAAIAAATYMPRTGGAFAGNVSLQDLVIGGVDGPRLNRSGATIRARSNDGLSDAPFSAGAITASGTIQSNASSGFAIGGIAGVRRISYASSPFTRFTFLSDSNATDRIAVDALSVGGSLASLQPPPNGIQSIGPNLIFNTYVSDTNFERGFVRWAGSVFQIGTEKGSSGGSPRGAEIITDGIPRLSFGPTAGITTNETFAINAVNVSGGGGVQFLSVTPAVTATTPVNRPWLLYTANTTTIFFRDMANGRMQFQMSPAPSSIAATASFFCNVGVDAALRWRPLAIDTPSTNGQFTVEMNSDTSGNLVYRGNDGATRRCRINFTTDGSSAFGNITATGNIGFATARVEQPLSQSMALRTFESSLSAWQEPWIGRATPTGPVIGFLGSSPIGRQTLPAAATDPATTQALANALRQLLINFGLAN